MTVHELDGGPTIIAGDVLEGLRSLPDESVQCVVTSPPYWGLRDYGIEGNVWEASSPPGPLSTSGEGENGME